MKPRLLNLAAGVSLLLAIVITALWVRGHARSESLSRRWHDSTASYGWTVLSRYSSLGIGISRQIDKGHPFAPRYEYRDWTLGDYTTTQELHWFRFPPVAFRRLSSPPDAVDLSELTIAYWLLLPLALILPTIAFARHRRRRQRETNNLCPTCGYDLRVQLAHAAGDRCPECGTSVQSTRDSCATQS